MTAVLLGIYPRTGVPAILAGGAEPSNRRDKEGLAQGTPTRAPPPRELVQTLPDGHVDSTIQSS